MKRIGRHDAGFRGGSGDLVASPAMEPLSTATGTFELERFPVDDRATLRGWDAADEYALAHVAELPTPPHRVVIVNDDWGALTCALAGFGPDVVSDSFIAQRAIAENLERNGIDAGTVTQRSSFDQPAGPIDLLIIKVPKSLALLEDQLRRLRPLLRPGTVVVGAGMTKHVHTSTLDVFTRVVGETRTSLARRKARLIFAAVDDSTAEPGIGRDPWPHTMEIASGLRVVSHAGVFSPDRLDLGTQLLIEHLSAHAGPQRIVDLGCGSGVIGTVAAQQNPEAEVIFIDESHRAVASAEATALANLDAARVKRDLRFVVADGLVGWPAADLDLVLANPPFHVNHAITDETAWRMFSEARRALRPGGHLWVVGNRHLAYHAKLKRLFGNCKVAASNPKFVLLRASRTAKQSDA